MIQELLKEGGLSLDRLESFCLVAQAGGVTKAAKGEVNRQTLYSRQIKELEQFFGVELVRRKGRGIVLTAPGERLNLLARECFASLLNFRTESKGLPVEIIIGAGESIIDWVLMPHLGVVRQNLRNTRLKFLNLSSTEVAHRLVDGMIDFGIVRKDVVARPLQWISLGVMNYSLFVPEALQVSGTGNYDRAKVLQTVPMATLEGEGSFRRDLSAISRKHRLRLQIEIECASFPLVARAVMTGAVAAVLPSVAASDLARLGVREVKISALDGLKRELCLAWNPRVLRIRTVLETARTVMTKAFTIPMA